MNEINTMQLVSYCRENHLCTGMSIRQYNQMLSYASCCHIDITTREKVRDVAVMIKICSDTDMSIEQLADDIKDMLF